MRKAEIFKVQKEKNTKGLKQLKKNYKHTEPYIHLTHEQRMNFLREVADLCSIALRRFFENGDIDLFNRIYPRFDKHREKLVGVRHFTETTCTCDVCANR